MIRVIPIALLFLTLGACAGKAARPGSALPASCLPVQVQVREAYQVDSAGGAAFAAVLLLLGIVTAQPAPSCQ